MKRTRVLLLNLSAARAKWLHSLKPRPNDRNMPTQHVATLLGVTCCVRLATVLRCVGCCWPWSNLSQQHPTCRNTSQHGGQTHATCCAQRCCDMLRWHVAIVWPRLYSQGIYQQKCVGLFRYSDWLWRYSHLKLE